MLDRASKHVGESLNLFRPLADECNIQNTTISIDMDLLVHPDTITSF